MEKVYRKEWIEAIKIWEGGIRETSGSTQKAQLSHNIAVAYEITGDVRKAKSYSDQAIEYLVNSYVTQYEHLMTVANYNDELEQRIREIEKINLQLGTETND